MRASYIGITLASHAREAGSTPAARSKSSPLFCTSLVVYLEFRVEGLELYMNQ